MENYGGYTWATAVQESSLVLAFLFGRIPNIHLKRAWPMAQLQAFVGNALGGKAKGGGGLGKRAFSTPELLPPHARPPGLFPEPLLAPQHCAALMQALEGGDLKEASWVLQAIVLEDDMERIEAVAEAYLALDEPQDEAGEPENRG